MCLCMSVYSLLCIMASVCESKSITHKNMLQYIYRIRIKHSVGILTICIYPNKHNAFSRIYILCETFS